MAEDHKCDDKLERMSGYISELKVDVGELKVNVCFIKDEMSDMKDTVGTAVEKMSETLVILATVTEKLSSNVNEHKTIHSRMDTFGVKQNILSEELVRMKNIHRICSNRRQLIEDEKRKTSFYVAKKKVSELIWVILFFLVLFIMIQNAGNFLNFFKGIPSLIGINL